MRPLYAAVVLAAVLAAPPAVAQVGTGGCPGPNPSVADQTSRMLAERHRGLLSRLYTIGSVAAGPSPGTGGLYSAAVAEGGYQFDSGDALALVSSVSSPVFRDPSTGRFTADGVETTLGLQYVAGLGRLAPRSAVARRAEVGVGLAASTAGESGVVVAQFAPRVVVPLTAFLSAPVGLQVSQPLGGYDGARTFVGLSIGLRTQYVPPSRLVLDCDGFSGSGVPQR